MDPPSVPASAGNRFVVLSGCSGGGKSTLLAELARRGHRIVMEVGRRIIAATRAGDGTALPWDDPASYAARALAMSLADHDRACGLTFFDRGVVDAAVALRATGGAWPADALARYRYDRQFLLPPWAAIYVNDADRRHSFAQADHDYSRVRSAYEEVGYTPTIVPCDAVAARADFILAAIRR